MKITFLYFKECPNATKTLELLKEVIKEKNVNEEIEIIEVKSENEVKKYSFLGSPTIQIDGMDIERERRNDLPLFGCRVYKSKDGYSGVPPKEMIVKALEEVKNKKNI